MPTLAEIQDQIKGMSGISKFWGSREIKELPNILWHDEKLENIVQGFYNKGNGILVATNKRLLFVDKGLLFGLKVEDFPYSKISSIQYHTGLIFGTITIFTSGNKAIIEQVEKSSTRSFCDWVRARITSTHDNPIGQHQKSNDMLEQLEKLGILKEKGILTESEFIEQKNKILNSK